jgi:ribosomal protein S4
LPGNFPVTSYARWSLRWSVIKCFRALVSRSLVQSRRFAEASWLKIDRDQLSCTVTRLPQRDEIDAQVNEQLIVELYSR